MDVGLVVSVLAAVAAAELFALARPSPLLPNGPTETALTAVVVGVIAGRLASLALDDPGSLFALRDIAALRGGVEFWPGVAAGVLVLIIGAFRRRVGIGVGLAALAPFGLVAVAGYQATCFVREGCFGPELPVSGPPGAGHEPMLPVEVAGAVVLVATAVLLSGPLRRRPPLLVIGLALWGLALQRAVVSFWLPVVGAGLSRPHRESIAVTALAAAALIGWAVLGRFRRPVGSRPVHR